MKTTNCKQIIEQVQAYLLEWTNDNASEYGLSELTDEEAFVAIIDSYMNDYGQGMTQYALSWATPAGVLRNFVEGGMMDCYYSQVNERLASWGLNPERYPDEKNWETYIHLICRDGERLYNRIKNK